MPITSIINVINERSLVCFVLTVLMNCGKQANVVRKPAASPIINANESNNYCIDNFKFNPASFDVLVGICTEPGVGPITVYL